MFSWLVNHKQNKVLKNYLISKKKDKMLFRSITNLTSTVMLRTVMSKFKPFGVRPMASISEAMLNQLKATHGKPITCKAAVAWEPKTPLDVTEIQVCNALTS